MNSLFATATPLVRTTDDGSGHPALKGPALQPFIVRNIFTDLKRHDLGPNFHERNYEGTFTELTMTGALDCRARSGKLQSARSRSRRLWGSGKGRYRTRGRNSSATVRGTIWLSKDTCETTTTTVKQGVVVVRDFAKHKNVKVRAGQRYVARARRR